MISSETFLASILERSPNLQMMSVSYAKDNELI